MITKQNTRQLNRKELRLFIALCFLCLCALAAWFLLTSDGILAYRDMQKQLDIIQAENKNLKEQNRLLQEKIAKITANPDYFEQLARDEYKMLKKNEMVFEFR